MNNVTLMDVNITDIIPDDFFKVSKKNYPAALTLSMNTSGMLEVPYIFKNGSGYNILTCHNRIKILRESGIPDLKCFILNEPDVKLFMNHVSLKMYRNELGPMGKLRTIFLINSFFKLRESETKDYCTKILKLPVDILENDDYLKKIMGFPETLTSYLDEKDVSFKVIKDLSLLPSGWITVVNNWLDSIQIRVNIFRMLIDNLFDIYRRGDEISVLGSIEFSDDKTLYDIIYRIRYPEFSRLKMKAEGIINQLSGAGLTIDFPEYFDRGFATIKLDINKKSDCSDQLKKISKIDVEKLKELISFL